MSYIEFFKHPSHLFFYLKRWGLLDNLSDVAYLKWMYRAYTGEKLNLKTPKTFNEKMQWLKLNNRKPEYTLMVDKYEGKEYVKKVCGGGARIIKTLGGWDSFDEINFDLLPDKFVLKTTHDSGTIVICDNKRILDKASAKKQLEESLKRNFYLYSREWPYKNVRPRILAEEYMVDEHGDGLKDYKFYCFNGVPKYLYVSQGMNDHKTARVSFITMNWEKAPFGRADYPEFEALPSKPIKFDKMVSVAKKLSEEQPFLRVDLYEISGEVYFSELTLFPCGGLMPFVPKEWDRKLGDMIELS